ncbi:MAG: SHOCT domain-containing protein [Chroococcales cyanobacterium]
MSAIANWVNKPKSRKLAVFLALVGTLTTPIPLAGIHKLYLGQYLWGAFYLVLGATPIPHVACAIEAVWYLAQDSEEFDRRFNRNEGWKMSAVTQGIDPSQVGAIAEALRQLDQLRQDGLMSEYEFEQKRRQLLDQIS